MAAEDQTDAFRVADLDVYSKQVLKVVETLIQSIKQTSARRPTAAEREAMFVQPASQMVVIMSKIMSIADEIEVREFAPSIFQISLPDRRGNLWNDSRSHSFSSFFSPILCCLVRNWMEAPTSRTSRGPSTRTSRTLSQPPSRLRTPLPHLMPSAP